jgi:hypothetical protein
MAIDDGFYGFVYSGPIGLGIGVFRASNGRLEGRDWDGVRYSGTAVETADGKIRVNLSQHVPPGVGLVGGLTQQDVPYRLEIRQEMPRLFGDGQPVEVHAQRATVMVKRIQDDLYGPTSLWSRLWTGS